MVEPTPICGNYIEMIRSSSISKEMIKKIHVVITCHTVREKVDANAVVPYKVGSKENIADLLTKAMLATILLPLRKKVWPKHFVVYNHSSIKWNISNQT